MSINFLAIILATIISFGLGSVWFFKLFGKTWRKIHHGIQVSPGENKMSKQSAWKFMLTEFVATFVISFFLYLAVVQSISLKFAFVTVVLLWLGFILPTITSTILWGNDEKKQMAKKIAISSSYRLATMLISAWIFFLWK